MQATRGSASPDRRRRRSDEDEEIQKRRDRRKRKESERDRDKDHNTTSKTTPRRRSSREQDTYGRHSSSSSSQNPLSPSKTRMSASDTARRVVSSPPLDKRESMPYPSFSKQHSRESATKENIALPMTSINTPDPTDDGSRSSPKSPRPRKYRSSSRENRPPSPPLTAERSSDGSRENVRRSYTITPSPRSHSYRRSYEDMPSKSARLRPSASDIVLQQAEEGRSRSKIEMRAETVKSPTKLRKSETVPVSPPPKKPQSPARPSLFTTRVRSATVESHTDSDATISAGTRDTLRPLTLVPQEGLSSHSDTTSSPHTPNPQDQEFIHDKDDPMVEVLTSRSQAYQASSTPGAQGQQRLPDLGQVEVPRVDYLLHNGGLPHLVPRSLVGITNPAPIQPYQSYIPAGSSHASPPNIFASYHVMLENFEKVLQRNGSIAVATGYKSVARRLLDRLEHVFARNISSEICSCIMCHGIMPTEETGLSWGEVLELVSGRRELPQWPPVSLPAADISNQDHPLKPMQKLDIDIPEEYREHYIRQSQKTKHSVQKWLASQPEEQVEPPTEVDDETLTFAILTYLEPDEKSTFATLMGGIKPTASAMPTPSTSSELMTRVSLSLQRLYHLPKTPRNPESAIYLLRNPHLHNALATLSAISTPEWDILTSGRFDGFLWSGAEDTPFAPTATPRTPSRGPTATPLSRSTTPFSAAQTPTASGLTPSTTSSPFIPGAPIPLDEETEIAVLAEVEAEIFASMDALEDAFQSLHVRAEHVRTMLQKRNAGLAASSRARREAGAGTLSTHETGPGTPWIADEDGFSDVVSLAPDDSASNIGWRDREKKRVGEREKERERRRYDRERGGNNGMLPTRGVSVTPVLEKRRRGLLGALGLGRKMEGVREE